MSEPINILLFCPRCDMPHIDAPQLDKGWTNPPHRSHECQYCIDPITGNATTWRPSDSPTNGVAKIETRGKADNWPPEEDHSEGAGAQVPW